MHMIIKNNIEICAWICGLTPKMKRIFNSENKITKRLESNGNICEMDIEEIKKKIIIAVVQ